VEDTDDAFRTYREEIDAWRHTYRDMIAISFDHFLSTSEWPDADELKYQLYRKLGTSSEDIYGVIWTAPRELGIPDDAPNRLAFRAQALRDIPSAVPYLEGISEIAVLSFQTYYDNGPRGRVTSAAVKSSFGTHTPFHQENEWKLLMRLLDKENWILNGGAGDITSRDWWRQPHATITDFKDVYDVATYLDVDARLYWAYRPHYPAMPTNPPIDDKEELRSVTHYHINVATAGQLNVNPDIVNNIQTQIEAIGNSGSAEIADAIKQLTEAVISTQEYDKTQRDDLIADIEDLATELQASQQKPSRIRAFSSAIGELARLAPPVLTAWDELSRLIK
jgi:hypothetical protein